LLKNSFSFKIRIIILQDKRQFQMNIIPHHNGIFFDLNIILDGLLFSFVIEIVGNVNTFAMNYEEIQDLRRRVTAGVCAAPSHNQTIVLVQPRGPRVRVRPALPNDDWDEAGFCDNFYSDEDENEDQDVAPNYFKHCNRLVTTYPEDNSMKDLPTRPLFPGSAFSAKDLARFLLAFKARHLKVGDGMLANIVATMATFLPAENSLAACLPTETSTYFLLKTLDNLASFKTDLRTLKIDCCVKKCMGFYAANYDLNFCVVCGGCRWKLCTEACFGQHGEKVCNHDQRPKEVIYYNVVQDRLVKLLKSDLKKLFDYPEHRAGKCLYMSVLKCLYINICLLACLLVCLPICLPA
jgi:hypothetical protein